jgi:hypothetical protein
VANGQQPAIASQIRSAASMDATGVASGMITTNSSPPKRDDVRLPHTLTDRGRHLQEPRLR